MIRARPLNVFLAFLSSKVPPGESKAEKPPRGIRKAIGPFVFLQKPAKIRASSIWGAEHISPTGALPFFSVGGNR